MQTAAKILGIVVLVIIAGLALLVLVSQTSEPICIGDCTYAEMQYKATMQLIQGLLAFAVICICFFVYAAIRLENIAAMQAEIKDETETTAMRLGDLTRRRNSNG